VCGARSKLDFFRSLSRGERQDLSEAFVEESYQPGETIVAQGELANEIFLIKEGNVKVVTRKTCEPSLAPAKAPEHAPAHPPAAAKGSDANEIVIGNLQAGTFFGESAIVDKAGRRGATIRAETAVKVLRLGRQRCFDLIGTPSADVFHPTSRSTSRRYSQTNLLLEASRRFQSSSSLAADAPRLPAPEPDGDEAGADTAALLLPVPTVIRLGVLRRAREWLRGLVESSGFTMCANALLILNVRRAIEPSSSR
jgi:CRP-like cAMP-binding protein